MAAAPPTWTEERIALLKQLFERGRTCREIAIEIGLSRNAVIGKIARLKLTGPGSRGPSRRAGSAPRRPAGARQLQILLKQRIEANGEAATPAAEVVALEIPQGPGCSLMELGKDTCRWPVGDLDAAEAKFCGNRPLDGLPYCAGHARIAYRAPSRRAG